LSDLQNGHPYSFAPTLLAPTLSFLCSECFAEDSNLTALGDPKDFQRFTIFAFNLLKQGILCPEYKMPKNASAGEYFCSFFIMGTVLHYTLQVQ